MRFEITGLLAANKNVKTVGFDWSLEKKCIVGCGLVSDHGNYGHIGHIDHWTILQ